MLDIDILIKENEEAMKHHQEVMERILKQLGKDNKQG